MQDQIMYLPFAQIDINDTFFDSLRDDYLTFNQWFRSKIEKKESAYVQIINSKITGFLYLKVEDCPINDVQPPIFGERVLKMGTLKIDSHGTRLGERFIKKSIDTAISEKCGKIYVTIYKKHSRLIKMFEKYGFSLHGEKSNGIDIEQVFVKDFEVEYKNIFLDYPRVNSDGVKKYQLAIYPKFHTKLFPDSILNNEKLDIIKDVSHTNSIEKIYICKMKQVQCLNKGDLLYIYRTKSENTNVPAKYSSVFTSICTVEDVKSMSEINDIESLKNYCKNYSVFTDDELAVMYEGKNQFYIIRMLYNIALPKRVTRGKFLDYTGPLPNVYWGFFEMDESMVKIIREMSDVNERYFIN